MQFLSTSASLATVRTSINFGERGGVNHLQVDSPSLAKNKWDTREVDVADVRGLESEFLYDQNGFQFVRDHTAFQDFFDKDQVESKYYVEVENLIKSITGASLVQAVNHVCRQTKSDKDGDLPLSEKKYLGPSGVAHCDYSYKGGPIWLSHIPNRPANWDKLSRSRWAIFSIWRPMVPVTRDALAVVDKNTVPDSDLIEATSSHVTVEIKKTFGLWFLQYAPEQRWYYKSQMDADDVLIIKLFDTKEDGRPRGTPHTSFQSSDDHGDLRKSIEVRCVVVWEGEDPV